MHIETKKLTVVGYIRPFMRFIADSLIYSDVVRVHVVAGVEILELQPGEILRLNFWGHVEVVHCGSRQLQAL